MDDFGACIGVCRLIELVRANMGAWIKPVVESANMDNVKMVTEGNTDLESVKETVQSELDGLLRDLDVIKAMVLAMKVDISNANSSSEVDCILSMLGNVALNKIELFFEEDKKKQEKIDAIGSEKNIRDMERKVSEWSVTAFGDVSD